MKQDMVFRQSNWSSLSSRHSAIQLSPPVLFQLEIEDLADTGCSGKRVVSHKIKSWIIGIELAGYALVLLVVWLDELMDLPKVLFGASPSPVRVAEALMESGFIFAVGITTTFATFWLLQRVKRLESYIVMCAWCRRVKVGDQWITFEEYLSEKDNVRTSHGLCEKCAGEQKEDIRRLGKRE